MINRRITASILIILLIFGTLVGCSIKSDRDTINSEITGQPSSPHSSLQESLEQGPKRIELKDFSSFEELIKNCTLLNDDRYSVANMIWLDNDNVLILQTTSGAKLTYRLVVYNCALSTETLVYSEQGDGFYEMEAFDDGEQFILFLKQVVLKINKEDFQVLDIQKKAVSEQISVPSKDGKVIYRDEFTVYMSDFIDVSARVAVVTEQNGEIFDSPRYHSPWSFDGRHVMLIYADAWDDTPPYWKYLIVDTQNGFSASAYEYKGVRTTDEMWSKSSDSFYVVIQNEENQNTLESVNIVDGRIAKMSLGKGNIQILGEVDSGEELLLLCDREGQWNIDLFSKAKSTQKGLFYTDYPGFDFKLNPSGSRVLLWCNNDEENTVLRIINL